MTDSVPKPKSSFSFSKRFGNNPVKPTEETKEESKLGSRYRNKAKKNPLLLAKTDDYVDDGELYPSKITRTDKVEYWNKLQQLKLSGENVRMLPSDVIPWTKSEIIQELEILNYPLWARRLIKIITSNRWDHWYINILIIWSILTILIYDGWLSKFAPTLSTSSYVSLVLMIPLIAMLASQLIPIVGIMYFITKANDLTKFTASFNFQEWGFCVTLLGQYIEYCFYSGQGLSKNAGNIHMKITRDNHLKSASFYKTMMKGLFRKGTRIDVIDTEDEVGSNHSNDMIEEGNTLKKEPENPETSISIRSKTERIHPSNESNPRTNEGLMNESDKIIEKSEKIPYSSQKENFQNVREKSSKMITTTNKEGSSQKGGVSLKDMATWNCITCGTHNNQPKVPIDVENTIVFGEKGTFYKQTYAKINIGRPIPRCTHCYTAMDYTPPLCSTHLFIHHPNPYEAFQNYPIQPLIALGLKNDKYSVFYQRIRSFFFGIFNDTHSAVFENDWRLKIYINHQMPEIPRYKLKSNEYYQFGEIIECKQQKMDWFRGKIMKVHDNHTYDLLYDTGDELRFVLESNIRCLPEKRLYAYRVELCMVIIVVFIPLGLILSLITQSPALISLGPLLISIVLFCIRLTTFIQYMYNYYSAGLCAILPLSLMYLLPLLFLMIASIILVGNGNQPSQITTATNMFITAQVFSLPILYSMRPSFALIGLIIFIQTSASAYLFAQYANHISSVNYIAIPFAFVITTLLTIKYLRYQLHNIWDVCLIIRKHRDTRVENPSIIETISNYLQELIGR